MTRKDFADRLAQPLYSAETHGFLTGQSGAASTANPFKPGTAMHRAWFGGWLRGTR